MKTRVVKMVEKHRVEIEEIDLVPGPGEVLVKTSQASICGTDKSYFNGHFPPKTKVFDPACNEAFDSYPLYMGHEGAGIVVEVGPNVTEFKVGDKVTSFAWYNTMADYFIAPVRYDSEYSGCGLHKVPEGMDMFTAALAETTCCPIFSGMKSGVELGDTVLICGTGYAGQIIAQTVKQMGAEHVICVDPVRRKRELAVELGGADIAFNNTDDVAGYVLEKTNGKGADVCFEVAGFSEKYGAQPFQMCTDLVKHSGIIAMYSWVLEPLTLSIDRWHNNGIDLRTTALMHAMEHNRYWWNEKTMDLMNRDYFKVLPLITDVFDLNDCQKAFEQATFTDDSCKVAFRFD